MGIYEKLFEIQQNLEAPKDLYNADGKFAYRSAERILGAVKPLLKEQKLVLQLNDKLVNVKDRYYVKATATLIDVETGEQCQTVAYAREEETKGLMDGSQITGASSSYARKYALNGMFAIDDIKDSDATNKYENQKSVNPVNQKQQNQQKVNPNTQNRPAPAYVTPNGQGQGNNNYYGPNNRPQNL